MNALRTLRLLPLLPMQLLPPRAAAQVVLSPGARIAGALEESDPRGEGDVVYDVYLLPEGLSGRYVVTLESPDFDVLLEWGRWEDGVFRSAAGVDDVEGLASPTDARMFLGLDGSGGAALRVSSLDAGPDGAYAIRLEPAQGGSLEESTMAYGQTASGSLQESDALRGAGFYDVHRFQGRAGERALIGLEADFDGYLALVHPAGSGGDDRTWEDDDGFGGSDAFLEVDLREDGEYRIVVTSFGQGFGDYRLRLWSAPVLVQPASGGSGASNPHRHGDGGVPVGWSPGPSSPRPYEPWPPRA